MDSRQRYITCMNIVVIHTGYECTEKNTSIEYSILTYSEIYLGLQNYQKNTIQSLSSKYYFLSNCL